MECEATESEAVEKVTEPALRVLVASEVAPSLKVTVPVGVPLPGATALTVAVIVTDWPNTDGFTEDASAVVLPALLTFCVKAEEVLVAKLVSPPYTAVIECDVIDNAAVVKVAWPELRLPVPNVFVPSLNVTVPVGVPAPGATALTVAVNVTDWPDTDGLED